jgi:hypothetical protein
MDGDGDLDFDDIVGFVATVNDLASAGHQGVPEPGTAGALLLGVGLAVACRYRLHLNR